jgi:16S rRNA (cytidine1402-2'-O)-methyltransferase
MSSPYAEFQKQTLYVVATPIGQLSDFSSRAKEVLASVQTVVAEDTRRARHLLQSLALSVPILSAHLRKEQHAAENVIKQLEAGNSVALISDAGTPGISDPGGIVVRAVLEAGYRVVPIPGACSAIAAWSASGFTETTFLFYGFLPAKTVARQHVLMTLSSYAFPIIFYEAPHRIHAMLQDLFTVLGDRTITVARELTKTYETIRRGSLADLLAWAKEDQNIDRGELVVIIEGAPTVVETQLDEATQACLQEMLTVSSLVSAVGWIQRLTSYPKDVIYKAALSLKEKMIHDE